MRLGDFIVGCDGGVLQSRLDVRKNVGLEDKSAVMIQSSTNRRFEMIILRAYGERVYRKPEKGEASEAVNEGTALAFRLLQTIRNSALILHQY